MADFDAFAGQLLEESKRFLEKSEAVSEEIGKDAYLHASLMLAFCALEARVNSITDEQSSRSDISEHERAFLLEKEVRLQDGEFKMQASLKMARLDERIQFLCSRLSGKQFDSSQLWWKQLQVALRLRNELTHPKKIPAISGKNVEEALGAIIATIDAISKAIYGKGYPAANRGLSSRLTF